MVVRGTGEFAPGSSHPHVFIPGGDPKQDRVSGVNAFDRGGIRVAEFRVLKSMNNVQRAMELLRRIASIVKPIMVKYDFKLPLLREILPQNHRLLGCNINRGQQICIRLRFPENNDDFYPEEDLVATMLHELTHNVRGPHDEIFWEFFHKISIELEERQKLGRWDGEGFLTGGVRLGAGESRGLPPHEAKALAIRKAEERRRQQEMMSSGRLGGLSLEVGVDPQTAARRRAEAAERRRRAEESHVCPSSHAEIIEVEEEMQKEERRNGVLVVTIDDSDDEDDDAPAAHPRSRKDTALKVDDDSLDSIEFVGSSTAVTKPPIQPPAAAPPVIVINSDSDDPQSPPAPPPTKRSRAGGPSKSTAPLRSASNILGARSAAALRSANQRSGGISLVPTPGLSSGASTRNWPCQTCTLLNASTLMTCEACGTPRPTAGGAHRVMPRAEQMPCLHGVASGSAASAATPAVGAPPPPGSGWSCRACGFIMRGEAEVFWSCTRCGVIKRT